MFVRMDGDYYEQRLPFKFTLSLYVLYWNVFIQRVAVGLNDFFFGLPESENLLRRDCKNCGDYCTSGS